MALWKPFRGNRTALEAVEKHDGFVYFCIDDGSLFFDYTDAAGVLQRKQINAKEAETIMGTSLEEIQKSISYNDLKNKPNIPTKISELTNDSGFITNYTETDPTVPAWAKASTKPSYTKSEVGLGNVDNVKQYSASNPPPYPVTKINNKTGEVTLSASDVGADASGTANSAVAAHNTNASAHSDIRQAISQLSSEKVDKAEVVIMVETEVEDKKGNIVQELIAELQGLPVFGIVDENNTVTVTSLLADGTYKLKYENADGSTIEIGTITVGDGTGEGSGGEPDTPKIYEVDIDSIGYTDGKRWKTSTGALDNAGTGFTAINTIPFTRAQGQTVTFTLSGITWVEDELSTSAAQVLLLVGDTYTANTNMPLKSLPKNYDNLGIKGVLNADGTVTLTITDGTNGIMYDGIRISGVGSGADAKITYTIE